MAEASSGDSNLLGDMFKSFPITTIIILIVLVYVLWRSTGGVERGIERHAEGKDSIFLEVQYLPGQGGQTFFGQVPSKSSQE